VTVYGRRVFSTSFQRLFNGGKITREKAQGDTAAQISQTDKNTSRCDQKMSAQENRRV
jgi:hypothetical protein